MAVERLIIAQHAEGIAVGIRVSNDQFVPILTFKTWDMFREFATSLREYYEMNNPIPEDVVKAFEEGNEK